jgi:hypothetical protein
MGNPLRLAALDLANHTGKSWAKNIRGGVLSQLAPSAPDIKVGSTDHFVFTGTPKAELVGESASKSSMDGTPGKKTVTTYKVQITYRFSNEVKWEDEDYQTGIIEQLVANVAIHGINPKTGEISSSVTDYFDKGGNGVHRVVSTGDASDDLDTAASDLQGSGYIATGIAFDPVFAGELSRERDGEGRKLYPELGFGFGFDNFQGLAAASSDTVSGRQELETGEVNIKAIMGDFRAFKWGVARQIPLELIEFGDPDGAGDLKRTNEVAIRAEAVFGFAIFDGAAFSIVSETGSSS